MSAIERCRTAALGGHVGRCENETCAHTVICYNSCLGQNRCAVVPRGNVGATPSSCIFEEVRLRHHGGLVAAAVPYRKGASHDCSSTTNDRGYAGTEFFASYPGILSPTGFAVRAPLR